MKRYVAVDQYGNKIFLGSCPRKELMEHHGRKSAQRTYRTMKNGDTYHVGYVVAGCWFEVFGLEGTVFRKKVG